MKEHTNKCVKEAIDSLEEKYGKYFKEIFKSMTTDNGHEFLNYDNIEGLKNLILYVIENTPTNNKHKIIINTLFFIII